MTINKLKKKYIFLKDKTTLFFKNKAKLFGKIIPSSVQNMYMLKILHLYTKNCYSMRFEKKETHEIFD